MYCMVIVQCLRLYSSLQASNLIASRSYDVIHFRYGLLHIDSNELYMPIDSAYYVAVAILLLALKRVV